MNNTNCNHINECSSYPEKCHNCKHNTNAKKDYYEPIDGHIYYDWGHDYYRPTIHSKDKYTYGSFKKSECNEDK